MTSCDQCEQTNARKDELDPIYSLKEGWTLVNISSTPDRYSPTEPRPGKQTHIGAILVSRENFHMFCQNISTPPWSSPTVWVPHPQMMWDCYFCSWDDEMTQIYHFLADYFAVQWWLKRGTTNKTRLQSQRQRQSNCTKKWQKVGWAHPMGAAAAFAQLTRLQTALSLPLKVHCM